jgi:large subunit ribosomal protein L23
MALFGKKPAPKAEKEIKEKGEPKETAAIERNLTTVIKKPRITEKAMLGNDNNVYAFEIAANATKHDVRDAVKAIWNVTPLKVHVVTRQPREVLSRARGRRMKIEGLKKAYVYLKKGDKIDLV